MKRVLHELRLVMDRHRCAPAASRSADPARQAAGVDIRDCLVDLVEDLAGIFPATHEDNRLHAPRAERIAVDGEDTGLRQAAHHEPADVAHEDRHVLL